MLPILAIDQLDLLELAATMLLRDNLWRETADLTATDLVEVVRCAEAVSFEGRRLLGLDHLAFDKLRRFSQLTSALTGLLLMLLAAVQRDQAHWRNTRPRSRSRARPASF